MYNIVLNNASNFHLINLIFYNFSYSTVSDSALLHYHPIIIILGVVCRQTNFLYIWTSTYGKKHILYMWIKVGIDVMGGRIANWEGKWPSMHVSIAVNESHCFDRISMWIANLFGLVEIIGSVVFCVWNFFYELRTEKFEF